MPSMKRRHFLQFSASTLAAMGLSQTNFLRQANHYGNALAQSTPRKLALLVGINSYPNPDVNNLAGCLTDIEMQYQLLVHRFGFNPSDIVMLSDKTELLPTRANILQAFEEHLIAQAKPGDVVVFHYSGHGSRVQDPSPIVVSQCGANSNPEGLNGTLVPHDAEFLAQSDTEIVVPHIMGRSLFLLMERVQTENLTVVLDSCFSGASTRGNATVRSATSGILNGREGVALLPSPAELDNQQRWLRDLKIDEAEFQRRRALGIARGVAIGSASCNQLAFEQPFDDAYTAGTFTYFLTSYLWQTPAAESANTVKVNLIRSTKIAASSRGLQVPIFEQRPDSSNLEQPLYFSNRLAPFADGVVRTVTGSQIEGWLGGVSYPSLKTVRAGSVYALIDPASGEVLGDMQLESRNGLQAIGKLVDNEATAVRPGLLLREKLAAIPNPTLRIGVDPSLAAERAAAETALTTVMQSTGSTAMTRITVVPVNQQANVEYVLARTTEEMQAELRQSGYTDLPPIGAVALYSADLKSVIPNSSGLVNELAVDAVKRLQPRLKTLLVAQVLQQLAGTSSDLQVGGEIYTTSGRGEAVPIVSRGMQRNDGPIRTQVTAATYQANDLIEVKLANAETEPVYLSCLVIDSKGNIITLHPANWNAPDEASRIAGGEELIVPRADDGVQFRVSGSGFVEVLTLVSKQPLKGLLRNLQSIARSADRSRGAIGFSEGDPLSLVDDLLGDVDGLSRGNDATISAVAIGTQDTAVDSGAIAAFSTVIEIVE